MKRRPSVRQFALAFAMNDVLRAMLANNMLVRLCEPADIEKAALNLYRERRKQYTQRAKAWREVW